MKLLINTLSIIIVFSLISCDKDVPISSNGNNEAKIQRKLLFNSVQDTIPRAVLKYQYDDMMNLKKINYCSAISCDDICKYEIFDYSDNSVLKKKFTFHKVSDSIGWQVHDSTVFEYENGRLILKETFYTNLYSDKITINYEYETEKLTKEYIYYNNQFDYLIVYDYNNGKCVKECHYKDEEKSELYKYIIHSFKDERKTKSEVYSSKNTIIQSITYAYDEYGNLTEEASVQLDLTIVKDLDYKIQYEYI
jgi:hypothetical protein